MACGFPSYAEKTERFRGASPKKLRRAAFDALDELGWNPHETDRGVIRANVPIGFYLIFMTWGAYFFVEVEDDRLFIRSEANSALQWLDFGQHADNIKRFVDRLEDVLADD
jgi:hypothetical protein